MTRNEEIYFRRQKGDTIGSIAQDYGISRERVRQICEKELEKIGRVCLHPRKNPEKYYESELYCLIAKAKLGGFEQISDNFRIRAYNALRRDWIRRKGRMDAIPPIQFFAALSKKDIHRMPSLGQRNEEFLLALQATLPPMEILPSHFPGYQDSILYTEAVLERKAEKAGVNDQEKESDLYRLLAKRCVYRGNNVNTIWAYDCLRRGWHKRFGEDAGLPTIDFLTSLSDDEIRELPNIGEVIADHLVALKQKIVEK